MAERHRDAGGRFISARAAEMMNESVVLKQRSVELERAAEDLVKAENEPPEWLKGLIVAIANHFGITPEEFTERVRIYHPTPGDPVLLVDDRAVVSWV